MSKGGSTRSGLLWQVERLLTEVYELPQILLMENVPQVISSQNVGDFSEWISFLDSLGYTSKYQILNAKNYNIPQNRQRCFMLSWQGDYYYDFPSPVKLEKKLRYLLEDEVDDKYFISDTLLETFIRFHYKAIDVGNGYRFTPIDFDSLERERERERERELLNVSQPDHASTQKIISSLFQDNRIVKVGEMRGHSYDSFRQWRGVYSPYGLLPTILANVDCGDNSLKVIIYEK